MSRSTAGVVVTAVLVGVVCLCAFLYWRWLHAEADEARAVWEASLAALRAAGEQVDPEDFEPESVPAEENALESLREVHDAYRALFPPGTPHPLALLPHDSRPAWSAKERVVLEAWWPQLEPLYEKVTRASARPVLVGTTATSGPPPLAAECVSTVRELLGLRALLRPEEAADVIRELLRIADLWRPCIARDALGRGVVLAYVCELLQSALDRGALDAPGLRDEFDDLLLRGEEIVLPDLRFSLRRQRLGVIERVRRCTDEAAEPATDESAEDLSLCRRLRYRPELYAWAIREVDRITAELQRVRSTAELRTWPPGAAVRTEHPSHLEAPFFHRVALQVLARLRLARWGLLLHAEHLEGLELADDLTAYADRFPSGMPLDPYTGRAFLFHVRRETRWLEIDVADATRELVNPWLGTRPLLREGLGWAFPPEDGWAR